MRNDRVLIKEAHNIGFRPRPALTATLFLLACCTQLSSVGHADIVAGVWTNGSAPSPIVGPPLIIPPHQTLQATTVTNINFDDATQPCLFSLTSPLRTAYAAQGVVFAGGSALDGGAILNQCGNFSVTGYSPPNFLAFNSSTSMQNGGTPNSPERLTFPGGAVTAVQMSVGGWGGGNVTITAYNALHETVNSVSGQLASTMQSFTVSGEQIVEVEVVVALQGVWVIDDLAFSPAPLPVDFGGRITSARDGSAIAGATVRWGGYATTSAADGSYSFAGLPCCTATLTTSKSGFSTQTETYTPVCNGSNAKNVSLAPWGFGSVTQVTVSPSVIYASPTNNFSVSCGLKEVTGLPVTFAEVAIAILDASGSLLFDLPHQTDVKLAGNGTWSFPSLSGYLATPGSYRAIVRGCPVGTGSISAHATGVRTR
jgi:hypothetical protein